MLTTSYRDLAAPEGATVLRVVTASLKRCPDTNRVSPGQRPKNGREPGHPDVKSLIVPARAGRPRLHGTRSPFHSD